MRVTLGEVQETLLIPLYGRAVESRKPHGLLHDQKALDIVAALDYDFGKFAGKASLIGPCLRTLHFDAGVRDFLARHPGGTVVELGAGLNTRYERIAPDFPFAHWLELDLPDAMNLRRQFFAETPNRHFIAASVTDPAWPDITAASPGPYCFISEAMLIFLPEPEVRKVLARLATRFPGSELLTDTLSPLAQQHQHRFDLLRPMKARIAWAIRHPKAFERWGPYTLLDTVTIGALLHRNRSHLPPAARALATITQMLFPPLLSAYRFNRLQLG